MRQSKRHVPLRVEAMESRTLLSALAPLSTPHQLDTSVTELRKPPHQPRPPRASVTILDRAIYKGAGIPIFVKLQEFRGGVPHGPSKMDPIAYNHKGTFNFGTGPPGDAWQIQIVVKRHQGNPPPNESGWLPLVKGQDGYYGKTFTIKTLGDSFEVST